MTAPFVMSVPDAGRRYYSLGRDASYAAAARGEIPSIRIGRRVVVPIHQVLAQQGMSDELIARVLLGTPPDEAEARSATDPATTDTSTPSSQGVTTDDHRDTPAKASAAPSLPRL